jgi:hypothetical protein
MSKIVSPEITFDNFLKLCKKHGVKVATAKFVADCRSFIDCELSVEGTFSEIGDKLTAFVTELKPYIKDKLITKFFNVEGGSLDLDSQSGYLVLKFFAKGVTIVIDNEETENAN